MTYHRRPNPAYSKKAGRTYIRGQATVIPVPHTKDDSEFRRKVAASKTRGGKIMVTRKDYDDFLQQARKGLEKVTKVLESQAWRPATLAEGVFKIFNDEGQFLCTGTMVANKMFVVLHALSEDSTKKYRAVNATHVLELLSEKSIVMNSQILAFEVNGIPSPFKKKDLRIMEEAGIVTVYGYITGEEKAPVSMVGFASPRGWCNAITYSGVCTSPVLDQDGKIVGLWTHGNAKDFGRFEPITQEFLDLMSSNSNPTHVGLAFRSRPLEQMT
jgi:hypothetical protein